MTDPVTDVEELLAPLRDANRSEPPPVADVARRARKLRSRRNAVRGVLATVVLLAVALPVAIVSSRRDGRVHTTRPVSAPTTTPPTTTPPTTTIPPVELGQGTPFIPGGHREGADTVLPITFLDGTSVELVYRSQVDLAAMSLHFEGALSWPQVTPGQQEGLSCCGGNLTVVHGDPAIGRKPTKTYAAADGNAIPYYGDIGSFVLKIGDWTVVSQLVGPTGLPGTYPTTEQQRATWARSLDGHQTADGFLVLTPRTPVRLAPTDAPDVELGDGAVGIIRRPCDQLTGRHTSGGLAIESGTDDHLAGTWLCAESRDLVIHLSGPAERIADTLRVR